MKKSYKTFSIPFFFILLPVDPHPSPYPKHSFSSLILNWIPDVKKERNQGGPELLHEDRESAQLARVDEVKQAPELPQVVLQGRPRQDKAVGGVQLLHCSCHL
jgi:hypothetical protein